MRKGNPDGVGEVGEFPPNVWKQEVRGIEEAVGKIDYSDKKLITKTLIYMPITYYYYYC